MAPPNPDCCPIVFNMDGIFHVTGGVKKSAMTLMQVLWLRDDGMRGTPTPNNSVTLWDWRWSENLLSGPAEGGSSRRVVT